MTIVVDTSAMVAILYGEPERERFRRVLELAPGLVEDVRPVLAGLGTSVAAVDEAQAALAQEGQVRFGLGRGKPPAVGCRGADLGSAKARRSGSAAG